MKEEHKNKIDEWAKKFDVDRDTLEENVKQKLEGIDNPKKEEVVMQRIYVDLKRNKIGGGGNGSSSSMEEKTFIGVPIGDSGLVDILEIKRKYAKKVYRENKTRAISESITLSDGTPVDNRKRVRGQENPNYGDALKEDDTQYKRTIYFAVINEEDGDDPRMAKMQAFYENAQNLTPPPLFHKVKFDALIGNEKDSVLAMDDTEFEVLGEIEDESVIEKYVGVTPLSEIKDFILDNEDQFDPVIVTEGIVASLRLEPFETGTRVMNLETEDLDPEMCGDYPGVSCWIPEHIDINFAENSWITVIGRPRLSGGEPQIQVHGIYTDPDLIIPRKETSKISTDIDF